MKDHSTKHTPGPWVWNEGDQLYGSDGSLVVETDSGVYPPRGFDRSLIAAAPDLLNACKILRRFVERWRVDDSDADFVDEAIAKAEGRP